MKTYPEPTVGAFIFNDRHEVFLIRSGKWPGGVWHVPGGHIEMGETIRQAVVREVREETGLTVDYVRCFRVGESVYSELFSRKKHFVFIEVECRISGETVVLADKREVSEYRWFKITEALAESLEPNTRKCLEYLDSRISLQTGDILIQ